MADAFLILFYIIYFETIIYFSPDISLPDVSYLICFFDVQAIVLKYIIFLPEELGKPTINMPHNLVPRRSCKSEYVAPDDLFDSLTEDRKSR